ncbi:hypothetical protein BG015_011004 [Linnemannia schmuckeri]|uniref:Uncharacterized protein n=1 Tax=Linnemannia schmuckeri TaxID=64567 RepID=A0A9P5RTB7_9FUNG|nr:hypothetical protein BG015_011004 [Linnemannia schmuckeri]
MPLFNYHLHVRRLHLEISEEYIATFETKNDSLQRCHQLDLFRETSWSLAESVMKQLQSITIPLSDIQRYLGSIHHLHRLDYIMIMLDEPFNSEWSASNELIASLKLILEFVKEHLRLFPGRLHRVSTKDSGMWHNAIQTCPQAVQTELYQLLKPLERPEYLTKLNWGQFAAHSLSAVDLCFVKKLHNDTPPQSWFVTLFDLGLLLQRCRSLERLRLYSPGTNAFKWAVVEINEENELLAAQLDDIIFAFSRTLMELRITAWLGIDEPLRIGGGRVCLPFLAFLDIQLGEYRLEVDQNFFSLCPNLITVLSDETRYYNCEEIETNPATSLEGLMLLVLCGWSALTFHPDTLYSTPELDTLTIETCYDDNDGCYIPSHEELDRSFGIEEQALSDDTMFPNLETLRMIDWDEITLFGLIIVSKAMSSRQFKTATIDLERPSDDEAEELGLVLVSEDASEERLHAKIHFASTAGGETSVVYVLSHPPQ